MENLNNNISLRPQTLIINDKKELYKSYMPFIQNGGLFLPFNDEITPEKGCSRSKNTHSFFNAR